MGEIKTKLHASLDSNGDTIYNITQEHTLRDIIRHLFSEGYDASEICYHVVRIEEEGGYD